MILEIRIRMNSSNDLAEYIYAYGTLTKLKGEWIILSPPTVRRPEYYEHI